jgi:hypothetical protein
VRRRLGAWHRAALRERVGPVWPPVADLPAVLRHISAINRELAPATERELERIVVEMVSESGGEAVPAGPDKPT